MRYFTITFQDLSFEKQQELIGEIKKDILETLKPIGEKFMNERKWYVKPKSWQEAFVRYSGIDTILWNDLDENSEAFQKTDWNTSLDQYADNLAEKRLSGAFHRTEVGV